MRKLWFGIVTISCITFFWVDSTKADCSKDIETQIIQIDKKIAELNSFLIRSLGSGPQVEVGSCASKLYKVRVNSKSDLHTFKSFLEKEEEANCLILKKFYLKKTCECANNGGYSDDDILIDSSFEVYGAIVRERSYVTKKGIKNPLIAKYVDQASKAIDCINFGTKRILDETLSQIELLTGQ